MAQKLFAPFKKIPSQVQSLPGIKQIFDGKRMKLQKELFGFTKCADFGLPRNPSAIAHDNELNLLAIGFESGLLKVVGAPGVSFCGTHPDGAAVRRLLFIPNEGRIVSQSGNKIFLWEINENDQGAGFLELKKDLSLPNEADSDAVTAMSLGGERIYVGCEGSQIRQVDTKEFTLLEDDELSIEKLSAACSDRFKEQVASLNGHWGAVTTIESGGTERGLLISYSQGLALVYREGHVARLILRSSEPRLELECATWCPGTADSFMTSFDSGSYSLWTEDISQTVATVNPYGPMPCWSIPKITRFVIPDGSELIAFVGGLPRAEYPEKQSVTLQQAGEPEVLLSLKVASPVVDILPLHSESDTAAHSLVVVCQDEIVALDFRRKGYPCYELPYLRNFRTNQSDITALALPEEPLNSEVSAVLEGLNSEDNEWPVLGGHILNGTKNEEGQEEKAEPKPGVIMATGHADGSVAIWRLDATTTAVRKLAVIESGSIFTKGASSDAEKSSDWPPLRAVGEHRRGPAPPQPPAPAEGEEESEKPAPVPTPFAVRLLKIAKDGTVVIGGETGQLSIWAPSTEASEVECDVLKVVADIIPDDQKQYWKWQGESALSVQEGELSFSASAFAPTALVQLDPPGRIRSVSYSPELSLLAVGSNHGYAVIDTSTKKIIATKSTLPEESVGETGAAAAAEAPENEGRVANIRKSLRNSFRRLKKLRPGHSSSYNVDQAAGDAKETKEKEEGKEEEKEKEKEKEGEAEETKAQEEKAEGEETKPAEATETEAAPTAEAEKAPVAECEETAKTEEEEAAAPAAAEEAEPTPPPPPEPKELTDDATLPSAVRCLNLARTTTISASELSHSLLVGTNGGMVFISRLNKEKKISEEEEANDDEEWNLTVQKRITMKHAAPVVHMSVLNGKAHHSPVDCCTVVTSDKAGEDLLPEETKSEGAIDDTEKVEEKKEEIVEEKTEEKKEEAEKTEETKEEGETKEEKEEVAKPAAETKSKYSTLPASTSSGTTPSTGNRATTLLQKTLTLGRGRGSSNTSVPEHHHELLVCTEEQAKLYSLPSLRVKNKFKVGEADARVVSATTQRFRHQDHSIDYSEFDIVVALSNGQVTALSLPTLRKQIVAREACKSDFGAVALGCSTSLGLYAHSDSYIISSFNLSICAPISLHPVGSVTLPEGARPPKEEPKEEAKEEAEAGEKSGEEAKPEADAEAAAATAASAAAGEATEAATAEETAPTTEPEAEDKTDATTEEKEDVGELSEKLGDVSLGSNKVADITQDSIKEYVEFTSGTEEDTKTSVVVHEETKTVDGEVTTSSTTHTELEINADGEKVSSTAVTTDQVAVEAGDGN